MTNKPSKGVGRTNCLYCGADTKADERKPTNGYYEVLYCSKVCRVKYHSMKSLIKQSNALKGIMES